MANAIGEVKSAAVTGNLPAGVRLVLDVPFDVNGKPVMLRFCDYASAGQTWGEDSALRVWLPQPMNLGNPFEGIPPAKK